jgi:Phasin protein
MAAKITKAEQRSDNPMAGLADLARFDGSLAPLWTRPMETWLQWQADLLKAAELAAAGWFERRRDATQAALETIEKLSHCNDLGRAASIQGDWLDGSVKRLTSDFEALTGHAKTLWQDAAAATRKATQSISEAQESSKHRAEGTQMEAAA